LNESLAYLSEAFPVESRAIYLREKFNRSLIASFKYLLDICEDAIPADLVYASNQKLDSLKPEMKLSGLFSALHESLYKGAKEKNIQRIITTLNALSENDFIVEDINYLNLNDLKNEFFTELIQEILCKEMPSRDVNFLSLHVAEFNKAKEAIQQGFDILKRRFPDFFQEAQELVSEILLLSATGIKSGTSTYLFGMIYKDPSHNLARVTDVLDLIIHEQSHLYLHMLVNDNPLVLNPPSEEYESPLRKEKRPLIGIYHATFVLGRMIYVLGEAIELHEIPGNEESYCREQIAFYKKRFDVGFATLKHHANMSSLGLQLINSASDLIATMK
jgi:hypothetical protein